jgi:hypothetical protein
MSVSLSEAEVVSRVHNVIQAYNDGLIASHAAEELGLKWDGTYRFVPVPYHDIDPDVRPVVGASQDRMHYLLSVDDKPRVLATIDRFASRLKLLSPDEKVART